MVGDLTGCECNVFRHLAFDKVDKNLFKKFLPGFLKMNSTSDSTLGISQEITVYWWELVYFLVRSI